MDLARTTMALAAAAALSACATYPPPQPMPAFPTTLEAERLSQPPPGACGLDTRALSNVWRYYPEPALTNGVQGWVYVRITVNTTGKLTNVETLASAPAGVFEQPARLLLQSLEFPPQDAECTRVMRLVFRVPY